MAIVTLTEENFDTTIASNEMVLIDFWAQWCGPCRVFSEVYVSLSEVFPEIVFGKINIEEELQLAKDFNIRSIPMLIIFRQGIILYAEPGALTQSALKEVIQKAKAINLEEVKKKLSEQAVRNTDR